VVGVSGWQARAAPCPDKPVLRALTCKLKGRDPEVRKAAIQALGELGHRANRAIPALVRAAAGGDPMIRSDARDALNRIRKTKQN
jgi:HEAT repeat protein